MASVIPSNARNYLKLQFLQDRDATCKKYGISEETVKAAESDPRLGRKTGDIKINAVAHFIWTSMSYAMQVKISNERKLVVHDNIINSLIEQVNKCDTHKNADKILSTYSHSIATEVRTKSKYNSKIIKLPKLDRIPSNALNYWIKLYLIDPETLCNNYDINYSDMMVNVNKYMKKYNIEYNSDHRNKKLPARLVWGQLSAKTISKIVYDHLYLNKRQRRTDTLVEIIKQCDTQADRDIIIKDLSEDDLMTLMEQVALW
jgi:hypothetical protein